ncbi:hypothetical protein B0H10DRAFT_1986559 [Mycena sp. CBHHK59/15]|nr:hypothetical protein B0H10DRAFT_1986559 [Mycena sp. CBHHK59/15]
MTSLTEPTRTQALLSLLSPAATRPPTRMKRLLLFLAVLTLSALLLLSWSAGYTAPAAAWWSAPRVLLPAASYANPADASSPWFRDTDPARSAAHFLARAQSEIAARALDTCNGKLGDTMVSAYLAATTPYCAGPAASITCFPVRAQGSVNAWWPYPQAFCASANLSHTPGFGGDMAHRGVFTAQCARTPAGDALFADMGQEVFLGTEFREAAADTPSECTETISHPLLFVPRQDRWNPFHVGEDLVTTFLALTLFARTHPPEETAPLQLVFTDDHLPTASLFAPLYDRIGAFPRAGLLRIRFLRTNHSPPPTAGTTCLRTAFHSVGAGASLLSGTGVGSPFSCASALVWGAGLWLRGVWGLEPFGDADAGVARRGEEGRSISRVWGRAPLDSAATYEALPPVQVLFLSRAKFDAFTKHTTKKLTMWQEARHITNEGALVAGLRDALAGLCRVRTGEGGGHATGTGTHDCTYTDVDALPDTWGVGLDPREARALGVEVASPSSSSGSANAPKQRRDTGNTTADLGKRAAGTRALRFMTLDPTTAALAAQLGAVGRADVVVSVHAGALGLALFMPTGRASVVELSTPTAGGNYHFYSMAHMLGMEYVRVDVQKTVDVGAVARAVRGVVERRLG